jgi:hypothetical protein
VNQSTVERAKLSVISNTEGQERAAKMMRECVKFYMLLVHQSRTGLERHYKILSSIDNGIRDYTSIACSSIGERQHNDRHTYVVRGEYTQLDAFNLSQKLSCNAEVYKDVFML